MYVFSLVATLWGKYSNLIVSSESSLEYVLLVCTYSLAKKKTKWRKIIALSDKADIFIKLNDRVLFLVKQFCIYLRQYNVHGV